MEDEIIREVEAMREKIAERHEYDVKRIGAHLRDSAAYFGFPFGEAAMREAVEQRVADLEPGCAPEVRLTLARTGALHVTAEPLAEPTPTPVRLIIAEARVDSGNPFRYHKTTRRGVYERAHQEAQRTGADEALLRNERGELTEGARTNLFVEKDGLLLTPPLECGVLNGAYRRHLLATEDAVREEVLHLDDLASADAIYVCNAVRGKREAVLMDEREVIRSCP